MARTAGWMAAIVLVGAALLLIGFWGAILWVIRRLVW